MITEGLDSMKFGNTVTLKAEITASPTPSSIQWLRINKKGKNEEVKNKSGKFLIKNLNESCQTLRIENLDFSDNGKLQMQWAKRRMRSISKLEVNINCNFFHNMYRNVAQQLNINFCHIQ